VKIVSIGFSGKVKGTPQKDAKMYLPEMAVGYSDYQQLILLLETAAAGVHCKLSHPTNLPGLARKRRFAMHPWPIVVARKNKHL